MRRHRSLVIFLILILLWAGQGQAGAAAGDVLGPAAQEGITRALQYLAGVQNPDGGFPAQPGGPSSSQMTAWVVMALVAAGEDPAGTDWSPAGSSPVDYIQGDDNQHSTGDKARTLLALAVAGEGRGPRGKALGRELASRQQEDGRLGLTAEEGLINYHMWSVLALSAAGEEIPHREKALTWLKGQQNSDGGFSWYVGGASDPDDTAVAIQALLALGEEASSTAIVRALAYLEGCQEKDGGFRWEGPRSNLASSAWVLQSLLAAGEDPEALRWQVEGKGVVDYLLSLQNKDGSFLWQEGLSSSPVQMTAYGVMALAGMDFLPGAGEEGEEGSFSDLPPSHWAYHPLERLTTAGVFTGYPDGTIRPEKQVTRAEFAALLVRGLGLEGEGKGASLSFTDVPLDHWAREAIAAAATAGFIQGRSDSVFDPNSFITGGEVMTMLVKALPQYDGISGNTGPHWYSGSVAVAEKESLLYPGFDPLQEANRGQCAYSLEKLLNLVGKL